eukprot:CAMPEP_0182928414 /NCGR_PEP_ID=MMETSP0105_2-20130417/15575_1 /TAXON_ID=81532 ORGANISM="Acanthoeca-like sp., Strain 10tr" /NCGR_SAMPLE_ID=MMETSP0105_2 /ASSEMBLY_ACC=CAM_ASM_000205 /LENGTH=429 /DNA_ID=CAMNT_0025066417 /DNA_START=77 /DNA_END=1366 /DNA_ORIENTATION=+
MAAADGALFKRFPECKYLGRIVLDGPTNARPHKTALQSMIETIERHAPSKNKRRLNFEIQTLRPVVPDRRETLDHKMRDTLVAFSPKGEELFRVTFSDIVSVGSSKRNFVFITLDERGVSTPKKASPAPGHGKFFVQAFRFSSVDEASSVSQNLVRAVERSRIKDMQVKLKKRHAASQAWTKVESPTASKAVTELTGRNSMMSPLPAEIPSHLVSDPQPDADGRSSMMSPRPTELEIGPDNTVRSIERADIQRTLDSHDLSPQHTSAERPMSLRKAARNRPSRVRAAEMQHQFGAAIDQASAPDVPQDRKSLGLDDGVDVIKSLLVSPAPGKVAVSVVTRDHSLLAPTASSDDGHLSRLSDAESGYTSEGSAPGSNVSLLSVKTEEEKDQGLTPSPLAKKALQSSGTRTSSSSKRALGVNLQVSQISVV